jgi:short-subunit dehydrogenase
VLHIADDSTQDESEKNDFEFSKDYAKIRQRLDARELQVVGGTSWAWVTQPMQNSVDVLVVDEANQMSLANVLAVSSAAQSMVLFGDPAQLDQPQKGAHPPGAEASALEHLLGNALTMPPAIGVFLVETRVSGDLRVYVARLLRGASLADCGAGARDHRRWSRTPSLRPCAAKRRARCSSSTHCAPIWSTPSTRRNEKRCGRGDCHVTLRCYPLVMADTIVVCGHGSGISDAVARRFGREGHPVAIVARNAERLAVAAKSLVDAGVKAQAFACDLGQPAAVKKLIGDVRAALGPIGVLHWNAYIGGAGDLTTSTTDELCAVLNVTVHGLVAAMQASLPDLKARKGAILVTGGGFAFYDPRVDAAVAQFKAAGLAIGKAAQHKTVGILSKALESEGVYVGEVVVTGLVKGTAFDSGNATLESWTIAEKFWQLYRDRDPATVTI